MKVMVLGAGGFIGSYIVPMLSKEYDVVAIYKNHLNLFDVESVKQFLEQVKPDVVVNCVSYGGKTELYSKVSENVGKNIMLFYSFYVNRNLFKKFINLGSGIELDLQEDNAYAFSKRIIQNTIDLSQSDKFLTLRIFGCFGSGEPEHRLLKRYNNTVGNFEIENNRLFDYFSVHDFFNVLNFFIKTIKNNEVVDISTNAVDCVYSRKITIEQFLNIYCKTNNLERRFFVKSISNKNYIGDSTVLDNLQTEGKIRLSGLEHGLKVYNE